MLTVTLRPHRASLRAGTSEAQKLFAMLKLIPQADVARSRPPLAFALVIDTSGSMYITANPDVTDEHDPRRFHPPSKLDRAIEAGQALIRDPRLGADDQLAVIHFDDEAHTLLPRSPLGGGAAASDAVESLRGHSGGTYMARGMRCALQELRDVPAHVAKRLILLTDGNTFDEQECLPLARELASLNAPVIAIGIGGEYNENLMLELARVTQGRPYHLRDMAGLSGILDEEVGSSVREVVTDLQCGVAAAGGVTLDACTRVYPSLSEVDVSGARSRLGNIAAGDYTVFILEFTVSEIERPPGRQRLAALGLAGHAPGLDRREEFPPQELCVSLTSDEAAAANVDPEVMAYVQQLNGERLWRTAMQQATQDAARARQTLQAAIGMTQRVGNAAVTRMLEDVLEELNRTGSISDLTRKSVALGGRTMSVRVDGATLRGAGLSDEEIRRRAGA